MAIAHTPVHACANMQIHTQKDTQTHAHTKQTSIETDARTRAPGPPAGVPASQSPRKDAFERIQKELDYFPAENSLILDVFFPMRIALEEVGEGEG